MTRTVAIVQSNYIPWKGYFDLIRLSDQLILYDEVQYTRHDWRNRNRIKTPSGIKWLTIPVLYDGDDPPPISAAEVADRRWAVKHWRSLQQNYARAPRFAEVATAIEDTYQACADEPRLSRINRAFIEVVCRLLRIETEITWSSDLPVDPQSAGKTSRLVDLCRRAGAHRYLSGPAARDYLDEAQFGAAGIEVEYMDYAGYPEYAQLHGEFEHRVTVLDLLFHTGSEAPGYLALLPAGGR